MAHQPLPVEGRVVLADDPEFGLPGVTVAVEGTALKTRTGEGGRFRLRPAFGAVKLVATGEGYRKTTLSVLPKQREQPVVIKMAWVEVDSTPVTVVAERPTPKTASTTEVSVRQMRAAPLKTAEDVLRQVPGLTLIQHGSEGKGHQFFLRGFDAVHGADLSLTLEGMPINEWSNVHAQGYLDLGFIIPELIRSVEVTKGPFVLDQGAFAMAGSADYKLGVSPDAVGWRAAYTVGTTQRHRIFAGYASAASGGEEFFGVEATHDDGFGQSRGLQRATANGRVYLFDCGTAGRLSLLGLAGYSAFELPTTLRNDDVSAGRVGFYDSYDPLTEGASLRSLAGLNYLREQSTYRLSLTGYGGYRRLDLLENFTGYLIDAEQGDRREQQQRTWSFGAHGTHAWDLAETVTLNTGAGLRGDVFQQDEHAVDEALERVAVRRDLEGTQLIGHALTGVRWSPVESVRLDVGGRLDVVRVAVTDGAADNARGEDTLVAVSPRMTARWRAAKSLRLFGAYGRGFRPPEARAFSSFEAAREGIGEEVFSGGDPTITVSDAFELGTRWAPTPLFGASLSGFATFIEREFIFDHVSGVNLELNGTRRLGAEVVLYSDPLPWLNLSADLTVVDAKFSDSGRTVPNAPPWVGGLRAIATHGSGFRAGARALIVAPRPLAHGATGQTLVLTDGTVGYDWRWLRLNLEVENVLDRKLREGEYHYSSHWRKGEQASELPTLHTSAGSPRMARLTVGVVY